MFFHMVYKSGQIFLPFCHNPRVWRTNGQTDWILMARPRLHSMQRGKNQTTDDSVLFSGMEFVLSLHCETCPNNKMLFGDGIINSVSRNIASRWDTGITRRQMYPRVQCVARYWGERQGPAPLALSTFTLPSLLHVWGFLFHCFHCSDP